MPISYYSIMDDVDLCRIPLSTNQKNLNTVLFDELCKRCLIDDNVLRNVLRKGMDIVLELDDCAAVKELGAFFKNLSKFDDEYFQNRWCSTDSVKSRLKSLMRGRKNEVVRYAQEYQFTMVDELSKARLSDDSLLDFLFEYLDVEEGMIRVRAALRKAYERVKASKLDATVSDLAYFINDVDAMNEFLTTEGINHVDDIMPSLVGRFEQFANSRDEELPSDIRDEVDEGSEHDGFRPIPDYILDAVRGRCFFANNGKGISVDGDEISYTPSIAPSYVRALMLDEPASFDMKRIIESAEDVECHASVRWEVSIKSAEGDDELLGMFLFDAQLVLLVLNENNNVEALIEALGEVGLPKFQRGGGIVLGVCDNEKETVRFLLADGSLPALDRSAQELIESVPAAIIPSFYQLSFLPAFTDDTDNEQVLQDIVHRLMLEYNRVKYADSVLDTFLDVHGFYQTIGTLVSSRAATDKGRKKAFNAFFERWLGDSDYDLSQMLNDIRGYGVKRNNDEAERLIVSIDAMRDDMNISSNEIRCLSYNSVERLSSMGIDERMLDVMEHKLDTLSGIISEMRTAINQTREKID